MSVQLFSSLLSINRSTFISEDIGFLTSFFSLQKDLPQERCIKPWVWFLVTFIVLSNLLDYVYLASTVPFAVTVLCLPYILYNLYNLLYLRFNEYRMKYVFNGLCACLRENHSLLKKLLTLAQEIQIVEKRYSIIDTHSLKLVKSAFHITVRLFNVLKDETKQALSLPATVEDLNLEDNYISCLPSQLFEELLNEDNPTLNQLKSLIQLVKIQQSEYLRRVLSVPISGPCEGKCHLLSLIIHSLQRCKTLISPEYSKLQSLHTFHHSSCYKQNVSSTSSFTDPLTFDTNNFIRSMRLHLRATSLLLENIETISSNGPIRGNPLTADFLMKMDQELTLGSECLRIFSKKIFKNDVHESFHPIETPPPDLNNDDRRTVIIDEDYKPTIEDQVFELFIDEDECIDTQDQDDIEESTFQAHEFATMSSNLFQELKTALIPKAEEIQEREAKALGIPKEQVPIQLMANVNTETLSKEERPKISSIYQHENSLPNMFTFSANLNSSLAARAAQISKDLNLNQAEECFGDSFDDEEDDKGLDGSDSDELLPE